MKKLFLAVLMMLATVTASSQYSFENADFEKWEEVSFTGTSTTFTGVEPVAWNSYISGTGSVRGGLVPHCPVLCKGEPRPGSVGSSSAFIKANNFGTLNFAGSLTTGCIEMGSLNQAQTAVNYNYTNRDVSGQAMNFVGRPDSLKVWARFKGTNKGQISAYLHTDGRYQFPVATGVGITATMVGSASLFVESTDEWKEYTIPFNYVNTENPAYALLSLTTSNIPGKGSKEDQMYIDDISLVYNSELSEIRYNGKNILDQADIDAVYDALLLTSIKSNGFGAKIDTTFNRDTYQLTVKVTAQDNSSSHTYTYQFKEPEPVYTYYTIVFRDWDETEISRMSVKEGNDVIAPVAPERDGYTFECWDPEIVSPVTADAVYTAIYTENVKPHAWPVAGTEKTYKDQLTITINGLVDEPQEGEVSVRYKDNGVIDFSMKNFVLVSNGDEIPIGNIDLYDVAQEWDSYNNYGTFSFNGNITIPAGTDSTKFWAGPYLGAIPLQLNGKMNDDKLHVSIFVNLMTTMGQMIVVEIGNDFGGDIPEITHSLKQGSITYDPSYIPWNATGVTIKYVIIEHSSDEAVADKEISRSHNITWTATDDVLSMSGTYTDTKYKVDVPYSITKPAKPEWILPTSGTRIYTENLYVTVAGTVNGPMDCDITVTYHNDNTIDLALYNFALQLAGSTDKMYVGNIVLKNLELTDSGHHYSTFEYDGNLNIQSGDTPADAIWVGPMLGEMPLPTAGMIDNDKMFVTIQLTAVGQKIDVQLGNKAHFDELDDKEFSGIDDVSDFRQVVGLRSAYDLQGRRVNLSSKGLKIVDGKLIIR